MAFDSGTTYLKSNWENYVPQISFLVCADIALHGFEGQAVSIGCDYTYNSFCALSGLRESSSVCEWGQSPRFYGDFTRTSPHPAAPRQCHRAGGGQGEEVEARKEHFQGGAWEIRLGVFMFVAFMVIPEDQKMEMGEISLLQGKLWGNAGLLHPNSLCTLCISQKHSRDKVLTAWSCLESQWSNVIQHSTSTPV